MKGPTKVLVALIATAPLLAYQASLRADDAATTRPAELPGAFAKAADRERREQTQIPRPMAVVGY